MKTSIETERLLFRELLPTDDVAMFALDSDPEVVKYVGIKPLTHIAETRKVIQMIRQQYLDYGIGRWAVILKETGECIGWAGLKYIKQLNGRRDNYDLGYRFMTQHWGKGYGTESAKAFIDFGFNEMYLERISAYVDVNNTASVKILEKCGLKFTNNFMDEGDLCAWYELENPRQKIQ
jgi:RimJ/RimL family protein N-acetyltransferase